MIYGWYIDGTPITGWPKQMSSDIPSAPILGTIDGDTGVDILVSSSEGLYIWFQQEVNQGGVINIVKPFQIPDPKIVLLS